MTGRATAGPQAELVGLLVLDSGGVTRLTAGYRQAHER